MIALEKARAHLEQLGLAQAAAVLDAMAFVADCANVVFLGPPGVG